MQLQLLSPLLFPPALPPGSSPLCAGWEQEFSLLTAAQMPVHGLPHGLAARTGGTAPEEHGRPRPAAPFPSRAEGSVLSLPEGLTHRTRHSPRCLGARAGSPAPSLLPELRAHSRSISDGNLLSQRLRDWQELQLLPEQAASCKCMSASTIITTPEHDHNHT